jgi:hypothetical protein
LTADAIVALAGDHLPISAPPREPKPGNPSPRRSSSGSSGGVPPASMPPSRSDKSPLKLLEQVEAGGSGVPAEPSAPPGSGEPGAQPPAGPATGRLPDEAIAPAPAPEIPLPSEVSGEPASESTEDRSSSTAGAILLGLLAGCVLFALGLATRRGWMRWRYGL